MTTRPTKTPAIPAPTADNLLDVAKAVKILLDIREGRLGDPRDAFLTVRDASSASSFQLSQLGGGGGGGGGGGDPGDTTPPDAPVGLTAVGAFAIIVLQWNSPATPSNVAYAEVWRSDADIIGSAVMIGTSASRFYTDSVGSSRRHYYWIRFVTRANVAGPYNATSGTVGETSTDPQTVLDVLNGALRESHLYRGLTEPLAGIVSGQDAAAESALAATLEARARSRRSAEAILALAAARGTDITETRRLINAGDQQLASLITTLTARVDDNVSAIENEATARASADAAEALQRSTLAARIDNPTVANNPTYAALQTEAAIRASQTGDLFGQYTVKVDLNGYVTGYGLASTVVNGVPSSEFTVVADRFSIAPVATSPGAADGSPFYVITSPTTIDGVQVAPGVYLKSAFIADATIGTAKIRSIAADKITAGYTASVDLESSVFAGSEFYIGGTVSYEFGDPARPTQRTGIASVLNPNVAFNSLGASFNVDYFRVFNGTTFETPFEISGGLVRAKRAQIQDLQVTSAKIDDMIQSTNWNGSYVAPAASADPHYNSTALVLNFDGSMTLDQSPLANVPASSFGITYQPTGALAGSGSLLCSSGSSLIYSSSAAFSRRSTFTLEFRIKWTSGAPQGYFMSRSASQYLAINTDGNLVVIGYGASLTAALVSGANHHIELCADGTTLRLFRDGALFDSGVVSAEDLSAQPFAVLGVPGRPDLGGPACLLDTVRLTPGIARHTAAFTPPAGPLPGGPTPGFFTGFGTAGWAISKNGDVAINSLYSRGAIAGGGFSPTDWAWPVSGGGFFVGPQGIRLGREASGQFFEVTPGGALRMPGLTISGGSATFSGNLTAGTVTTDAILGGAASSASSATSSSDTVQLVVNVPTGASAILLDYYLGPATLTTVTETEWSGGGKDSFPSTTSVVITGPILKNLLIAYELPGVGPPVFGADSPATAVIVSPTPGLARITCQRGYYTNGMRLSALILKR